jgi:phospholipase/carboxylesterase
MLKGPRLLPLRGEATHLVVLVHGYGADGNDLISLAGNWQELMPTVEFVAPNAPERVPGAPNGYQWFGLTDLNPQEKVRGVQTAAPVLDDFLKMEEARLGMTSQHVALVGFSQGTMLSLHVGLRRRFAAIVGFSGSLVAPPPAGAQAPPILLTHGTADQVIPALALFDAATTLGAAGACVQWHLAHGIGHGIDQLGMEMAGLFLADAFAGRLARNGPACCPIRQTRRKPVICGTLGRNKESPLLSGQRTGDIPC